MNELTKHERNIMQHALCGGTKREYRNHFVTGPGSDDYDTCMGLTERGLMQCHKRSWIMDSIFIVTDEGRRLLRRKV